MRKKLITVLLLLTACITVRAEVRPRVVIMTDAETDDRCSMVHALLYANDMDIEAIIQTNSCFQRKGWSHEPWLREMIDAYAQVLPNLRGRRTSFFRGPFLWWMGRPLLPG